jgi:MraZ protein
MELKTGTFESTLDDKGRVSIPARLRDFYSESELVITQGMQPSVWIMPEDIWQRFCDKILNAGDIPEEDYYDLQYQYIIPAQGGEIDQAGRIAIPPAVRRYAWLVKDWLVLRAENHLEIWDAEYFYAHVQERRPRNLETMRRMGALRLFRSQEN